MNPIRSEYSRLRTQAQHRLSRLRAQGIGTRQDFPKAKGLTDEQIKQAIDDIREYLTSGDSLAKRREANRRQRTKAPQPKPTKPTRKRPRQARKQAQSPLAEISQAEKDNYTKMRDIAHKRLARLHAQGLGKQYTDFPKLSQMTNAQQFRRAYDELTGFLMQNITVKTEKGRKQQQLLDALADTGLYMDKAELEVFGDFMEFYRELSISSVFDSGQVAEMFDKMYKMKINPEDIKNDFDLWLEHMREIQNLPERTSQGKAWTSERLKAELQSGEEQRKQQKDFYSSQKRK